MECLAGEQKKKEVGRKKKEVVCLQGRARKICFERRRKGLQKKASQLASLCGVRIALVIKDIDDAPDMHTWPPNLDEVRCTVESYQQRAFDVKAGNTTGKKGMWVDTANFASLGSKKTKSNHQKLGEGGWHCGCHLDDLDLKLESINHRIGVITMPMHTADSVPVPNVPSCSSLTPIDLSGEEAAWCDITEPEDSYALPFSVVTELDDSHTDLGPPTACCPTAIGSYNAAWGDVILPDDLYADIDATRLIDPLAEAAAFSHPFRSSSAAGSNFMGLGPKEDFYPGDLSDLTEVERVDFFNGLDALVLLEADDFVSYDPLALQPSSPSSCFDPSSMFHGYCSAVTDQFH